MALRLGQRVRFSRDLVKSREWRSRPSKRNPERMTDEHWRVWKPSLIVQEREGIVVGTRTLMNVEQVFIGYEEGWDNDLATAERFQAVLVAYDIRRKPVFVLPEELEVIE